MAGATDLRRLGQAVCATQVRNSATSTLRMTQYSMSGRRWLFDQHPSNSKNLQLLYELYHDVRVKAVAKFSLRPLLSNLISLISCIMDYTIFLV